jgi:pimeloyl-ACP methyl ester carboxylesterase
MAYFRFDGQRLAYTIHGQGPRATVLLPALPLSQKMQAPLAADLAAHGNRVVTLDFLGHGDSDRPKEMGAGPAARDDHRDARQPGAPHPQDRGVRRRVLGRDGGTTPARPGRASLTAHGERL